MFLTGKKGLEKKTPPSPVQVFLIYLLIDSPIAAVVAAAAAGRTLSPNIYFNDQASKRNSSQSDSTV